MVWEIAPRSQEQIKKSNMAYLKAWDKFKNILIKRKSQGA